MKGGSLVAGLVCSVALGLGVSAPASADQMLPDGQIARVQEWWLGGLGITAAQKAANGGAGVTVCVIDDGVATEHPDLAGANFSGGTDLSGQGSPDGLAPIKSDTNSAHGTSMAAWIVGQGHGANHGEGILGVAPKATVMSVSIGGNGPNVGGQPAIGLRYCVDHGAKVISVSLTGNFNPSAISYAEKHDAVIVNAAGNNDSAGACTGLYDATVGVLTVSGVANGLVQDPTTCTNKGRNQYTTGGVTLAAPSGGRMKSASESYPLLAAAPRAPMGDWYQMVHGGSSTATAITSGVVALVRARYPHLSAAGVVERLLLTAKKPADGQVGPDAPMGFGVVDAQAAVTGDAQEVSANPLGDPSTGDKGIWGGASLTSFLGSKHSASGDSSSSSSSSKSSSAMWVGLGVLGVVVLAGVGGVVAVLGRRKRA